MSNEKKILFFVRFSSVSIVRSAFSLAQEYYMFSFIALRYFTLLFALHVDFFLLLWCFFFKQWNIHIKYAKHQIRWTRSDQKPRKAATITKTTSSYWGATNKLSKRCRGRVREWYCIMDENNTIIAVNAVRPIDW